jgi:hypothetical protein
VSTVYIRFPAPPPDPQRDPSLCRAPLLEGLLARADSSAVSEAWRADAFGALSAEAQPAIASVGMCAASLDRAEEWACAYVATPVSYQAAMTHVRMPPGGVLSLPAAAATLLAADFNRVFTDGGQRLHAARDGALYCTFASHVEAETTDPATALGGDIGAWLPRGGQGALLRGLMSEIEMWLFDHALNERRVAAGEPPISGLWLWGGGPPIPALPRLEGWVAGRDALFSAWSDEAADPRAGPGVAILDCMPGSLEWQRVEARWIVPAVQALRANRRARVVLSAGVRRYSLSARSRWRWWRRPKAWWEYFA